MKHFLLFPTCAIVSACVLSSCQKEDKSALTLVQDLTTTLQTVTDYKSAEAAAPRVAVLNQRCQDAGIRVFALNETALLRSTAGEAEGSVGIKYAEALAALACEVGRVKASAPVSMGDDGFAVDRDKLVLAIGAANGAGYDAASSKQKEVGTTYLRDDTGRHETPGEIPEFYGSSALAEALDYEPTPVKWSTMDDDSAVPAIPELAPVADDAPAADDEGDAEEPAETEEEPAETDTADETAEEETGDDSMDIDIPADDTESTDDSGDGEVPAVDLDMDDSSEEDSSDDTEDAGDDSGDDAGLDDFEIEI